MSEPLQLFINGLVTGSIITLGAVGISLALSTLDIGSLTHGDYMAVGAFAAYFFNARLGMNIVVSFALGAAVTGVLGVVADRLLLQRFSRRSPDSLLIVTLGLGMSIRAMIYLTAGAKPRQFDVNVTQVFDLGLVRISLPYLINLTVAVTAIVGVALFLSRTSAGKHMRAMSNDRELASIAGIDVDRMRIYIWLFAAILAGLAGSMLGLVQAVFSPELGWNVLFLLFTAVILGGIGNVYGTLVGGLLLGLAIEIPTWSGFFGGVPSVYKPVLAFGILLVLLFVRPAGLFGKARLL